MQKWIVVFIVNIAYFCVMDGPITKAINKNVSDKRLASIMRFAIMMCILMVIFGVANLCSYW